MSSSNPRPLLSLHIGQAGIQIGHATWELLCLEHNIEPNGDPKSDCGYYGNVDSVFLTTPRGQYFPRSIFIDTDPFCIDEIRSGPYRGLFNNHQLLSDQVDSGTNYATGRYGYTKSLLPETTERLRWLMEKTDVTPTVCLFHSSCGGTGSGFSVACLTQAQDELGLVGRNSTLDICVVPGQMAVQNCCELLNTALYLEESQELVRQTFCVSNSALFRVCTTQLQSNGKATYAHVNRILAAAFSNLTATERLPGSSVGLYAILDNLMPYENLKYPLLACAPFVTTESARIDKPTVKSVTSAVLEPGSQFLDVDPRQGHHIAGYLLYRGAATVAETQSLAQSITATGRAQFHDWGPSGFRTGLVALPPLAPPHSGMESPAVSVTMVSSHSGISKVFAGYAKAARRLLEADLFVHSYEVAIVAMLSHRHSQPAGNASNAEAEVDLSGVSHWTATLNREHGRDSEIRQVCQRRRQTPPSGEGGEGCEQRRTGAMSDVFGVRQRLSNAIDYLEQAAKVYAADNSERIDQPEHNEDMVRVDHDARLSELVASRSMQSSWVEVGSRSPDSGSLSPADEATETMRGSAKNGQIVSDPGEGATSLEVDNNGAARFRVRLSNLPVDAQLSSPDNSRDQQSMQHHNCSVTMSSPRSQSSGSFRDQAGPTSTPQSGHAVRRTVQQFGCLRRKSKKSSAADTRKQQCTQQPNQLRLLESPTSRQPLLRGWSSASRPPGSSNNAEYKPMIALGQNCSMQYRL